MSQLLFCLFSIVVCISCFKEYTREKDANGNSYLLDRKVDPKNKLTEYEGELDYSSGVFYVDFSLCDKFMKNGMDTVSSLKCERTELNRILIVLLAQGEKLERQIRELQHSHKMITDTFDAMFAENEETDNQQ